MRIDQLLRLANITDTTPWIIQRYIEVLQSRVFFIRQGVSNVGIVEYIRLARRVGV